jgi:hypothetical protein
MFWLQYDYQDQNRNWSGTSKAPSANNGDKEIETHFATLGFQYMFNRSWGVEAEIPYDFRNFRGTMDDGTIASHHWSTFGDIRLNALYTGFADDMSSGVTLGLKLPSGQFHVDTPLVDRDTQIGTGSTDALLGAYHRGKIGKAMKWEWFAQMELDLPAAVQEGYRPGIELDVAAGIDYTGFSLGRARIMPLAQIIFSERTSDGGWAAAPSDTGYQRVLLSPGIDIHIRPIDIYADVEIPVFQHFTGNQLSASVLFKAGLSYMF